MKYLGCKHILWEVWWWRRCEIFSNKTMKTTNRNICHSAVFVQILQRLKMLALVKGNNRISELHPYHHDQHSCCCSCVAVWDDCLMTCNDHLKINTVTQWEINEQTWQITLLSLTLTNLNKSQLCNTIITTTFNFLKLNPMIITKPCFLLLLNWIL